MAAVNYPANDVSHISKDKVYQETTFLQKYSDLIQSICITALDVIFLGGAFFSKTPSFIPNMSFFFLNFTGLISWNFQTNLIKKSFSDILFAFSKGNHSITLFALLRTIFVVSGLFLCVLHCSASVCRLLGFDQSMRCIYVFISPFSIPCVLASILLDIGLYFLSIQVTKETNLQNMDILESFGKKASTVHADKRAAAIRYLMDKDTWTNFFNNLHRTKCDKEKQSLLLSEVALINIRTQRFISVSNIALRLLGSLSMMISNLYPGTRLQACIWTGISSLYTGQLIFQKCKQARQRLIANKIVGYNQN